MLSKITKTGLALLMLAPAAAGAAGVASAAGAHHEARHAAKHAVATVEYAHAILKPAGKSKAHGTVTLALDTKTHVMTVVLQVWGLAKDSKHPAHIHAYSGGKSGKILYPLDLVTANAKGYAKVTTVVKDVKALEPGKWIVNVHEGLTNFTVLCDGVVVAGK
jgi:hypothetical protein